MCPIAIFSEPDCLRPVFWTFKRRLIDVTGFNHRISRQDDVMAQVNNHTSDQVMYGLFANRGTDTVLDAMADYEKLSLDGLDNEQSSRRFALLVLKMLTASHTPTMG